MSKTTDATSGAGTAHSSGTPELSRDALVELFVVSLDCSFLIVPRFSLTFIYLSE